MTDPVISEAAAPVNPEVQAQLDREARADQERLDTEERAQTALREREEREADELSQEDKLRVALNQRVEPRSEATFLAGTGHNTADDE